ncbi:MAG: sulfatase-like hydrolase/transferase [Pirellulaceae bacterium]|nr:sulfatase-like hydrolase/transferase [Pirellulaceae bacterium]
MDQPFCPPSADRPRFVPRRVWCALLAAAVLLPSALAARTAHSQSAGERPEGRPNVVLIMSDDQGYRDLGCYGGEGVRTPALDRLAAEGVRLTSFYVAWPACTPSRAALLTGRYPQRNGTYDMIRNDMVNYDHRYTPAEYAVSPERILGTDVRELFVSELLQQHGYTNGCYGKWDGGQLKRFLPLQQGFADFYGFTNTGIDYFTHERYGVPSMRRGNQPTTEDQGTYCTTLFRREAERFLHANHQRPFFLYLPFNAPHGSSSLEEGVRGTIQAPPEYLALYPPGATPAERRRQGYLAAITCMDEAIGRLLELLDHYQLAENTLVVFLSDNGGGGGSDNRPLRGGKSTMFEGGLRVPCLVRWPARLPAGQVSDAFLTSLELFPTIAAATGCQPPADLALDGFDMLPVLRGQPSPRPAMFWQRREDRAARVGQWKWVDSQRGGGLFDLSEDVGEQRDLSAARPDILQMVQQQFAAWSRQMEAAEPRGPFRDY